MSRWVPSGEVRLAVVEDGDPALPTVVFVHGYPDTKEVWDPVRARLRERFHTVAYDVRGAGQSSAPKARAAYDFERLGDDLEAVLAATAPERRVHLVGHDWGGLQGWEFATSRRFEGRLASYTAVAAPSLDQVSISGQELVRGGHLLRALVRARRSWYILVLLMPGGPQLIWRPAFNRDRFRRDLREREGVPAEIDHPAPTLASDGIRGANLYRRNIPRRTLRPRRDAFAHVPVQLIVPERDRFISPDYYEHADRYARGIRRRSIDTTHWAQLTHPDQIAEWIGSFVDEVETVS